MRKQILNLPSPLSLSRFRDDRVSTLSSHLQALWVSQFSLRINSWPANQAKQLHLPFVTTLKAKIYGFKIRLGFCCSALFSNVRLTGHQLYRVYNLQAHRERAFRQAEIHLSPAIFNASVSFRIPNFRSQSFIAMFLFALRQYLKICIERKSCLCCCFQFMSWTFFARSMSYLKQPGVSWPVTALHEYGHLLCCLIIVQWNMW